MALKNFMTARSEREGLDDGAAASVPAPSDRAPRTVAPATSIDASTEVKGTLRCKETLRIDGRVKGEVICEKMVLIGEGGKVHASITADSVEISGEVKGDITASRKITLNRSASVTGNLSTPGIVIQEGAKLEGRILIGSDAEPIQESKPAERPRTEAKPARGAAKVPRAAAPPPAIGH